MELLGLFRLCIGYKMESITGFKQKINENITTYWERSFELDDSVITVKGDVNWDETALSGDEKKRTSWRVI